MKRNSPLVRRGSEIDIDNAMTPMIDVVFLLLVFFVWTASFQIIEHVLPSEMSAQTGSDPTPQTDPPPPPDFDDVVIRIGFDGQQPVWKIGEQPIESLDAMQQHLAAIAAVNAGSKVILHPQPIVPLGHVIAAYDVAKVAGLDDVSFAVNLVRN